MLVQHHCKVIKISRITIKSPFYKIRHALFLQNVSALIEV
jgi:hypothetical protein